MIESSHCAWSWFRTGALVIAIGAACYETAKADSAETDRDRLREWKAEHRYEECRESICNSANENKAYPGDCTCSVGAKLEWETGSNIARCICPVRDGGTR